MIDTVWSFILFNANHIPTLINQIYHWIHSNMCYLLFPATLHWLLWYYQNTKVSAYLPILHEQANNANDILTPKELFPFLLFKSFWIRMQHWPNATPWSKMVWGITKYQYENFLIFWTWIQFAKNFVQVCDVYFKSKFEI